MKHSSISKRTRQLAVALAIASTPAIAAAQGNSAAGTSGSEQPPAGTGQVADTQGAMGASGTTAGTATGTASSPGYGDPNAVSQSPPMGTPAVTTSESGGDVDKGGGGSNWGWLGLLGLLGLAGMRKRVTVVDTHPQSTRV